MYTGRSPVRDDEEIKQDMASAEAIGLMEKALKLLDENKVPGDASAHLDLAIHRLREWIQESEVR